MNLATIRTDIADKLAAVGLTVLPNQPGAITTPGAFLGAARVNPRVVAERGDADVEIDLYVIVSRGDNTTGRESADAFMSTEGASSVIALLEADPELTNGGDVACTGAEGPGDMQMAGVLVFGSRFVLEVYA